VTLALAALVERGGPVRSVSGTLVILQPVRSSKKSRCASARPSPDRA